MSEDLRFWYGGAFKSEGGAVMPIPTQAIPYKKKTDKWKRANLDAFEAIGKKQLADNMKFADIFRMISGKMSYSELSEVAPQYRELEQTLNDVNIDTWIRHYDIIGVVINALAGELSVNSDKFSINTIDEFSTNEYIRTKTEKLQEYISVEFDKQLRLKLLAMGLDENAPAEMFQSPEEMELYKQQIQQRKAELTPPQIEKYMQNSWKTVAAKWAHLKLEEDNLNHNMSDIDNENFVQYLATGRCFRSMYVGHDYYKPEVWHVLNTFYSQDLDNKHVQHGDYVGRIHKYTKAQVINKYGHKLTEREQKKILKTEFDTYSTGYEDNFFGQGANVSYKKMFESHFHNLQTVAFEDEPEYRMALDIQESLGIPMGERVMLNRNGEYEKVPVLLPSLSPTGNWGLSDFNDNLYSAIRNEVTLRSDLLTVTEVFWRSYKRVGYLKYKSPDGNVSSTIVSEELLPEFLEYNSISKITELPISKLDEEQEENTIIWTYQPEVWQGVKINDGEDSYYVDIEPCPYQIKGDGNVYDVLLPVAGIVDVGLAQKLEPYQVMYNVIMNQIFNLLEKEIGLFFIFDVNFLPSEFKDWGDTEDTLLYMRDIAKDIGILPIDSSKQNLVGGANFNQFAAQNLSFSTQINDRVQLAEFVKNKAFEQIGITPQRLGAPNKYETQEGIKVSQDASYAQTEKYFSTFSTFKKKALELHLNVAQYCQKEGKDLQLFFTQSDATQAFIQATDEHFSFRRFSIVPISNSKKREQLRTFKAWVMNNNTLGTDELAMAEMIASDSMNEIIEASRAARLERERAEKATIEATGEQQRQTIEAKKQADTEAWEREEYSKDKDRAVRIQEVTINSMGKAADKDAGQGEFDMILKQANLSLAKTKTEAEINNKSVENNIKQQAIEEAKNKRLEDMKLKLAELATRRAISQDNKDIARMNKN